MLTAIGFRHLGLPVPRATAQLDLIQSKAENGDG
jgi:hypothetical protein